MIPGVNFQRLFKNALFHLINSSSTMSLQIKNFSKYFQMDYNNIISKIYLVILRIQKIKIIIKIVAN